jgi:hypothetical protein
MFYTKVIEKNNIRILRSAVFFFFFLENHAVYEIMSQNIVEPEGPQMTSQYDVYALHAG